MKKAKKTSAGKNTKKSFKKDEKLLEEIAQTVKDSIKVKKMSEESELETDVETDLSELDNFEFNQMMRRSFSNNEESSPVLERVASEAVGPRFFSGSSSGRASAASDLNGNGGNGSTYISSKGSREEPKYISSDSKIYSEPERINFEEQNKGFENNGGFRERNLFTQSQEAQFGHSDWTPEKLSRVDRFETEDLGRKRDDIKYEKYKPSHK